MNQIVPTGETQRRAIIEVQDPVPLLDTSQFEHMQRIATVMARTSLIPESLYKEKEVELPFDRIISNCFLVVNQAVRWGMDPFAVAQCVAVVKGKLCYEGKLVSAVLDAKLGLRLHHHIAGSGDEMRIYLSDVPFDEETLGELKPGFRKPGFRLFDGSVGEWKTTGNGSPWSPKNFPRMLVYRGTRDWCRIYEPAIMLGVYTPDEMIDLAENARSLRARDIGSLSLQDRLAAAKGGSQASEGFDPSFVTSETASLTSEAPIEQNPGSSPSPTDEPEDSVSAQPSPDSLSEPEETPVEAGAEGQEQSEPAPASEEFSDDDWKWIRQSARRLWISTGKGEQELVEATSKALVIEMPETIGKAARDKATSIKKLCKAVCYGEMEIGDARKLVATHIGASEDELRGWEPQV